MHAKLRWGVALASGLVGAALFLGAPAHAQPLPKPVAPPLVTPSVTVDPAQPGATPHWTITLGAEYCGGYRVGDGVYVSPEAPLSLAAPPPDGSTLFAGQPASMDWSDGTLRIGPGQGLVLSMVCLAGQRPLKVELLPDAGLSLPTDPGDYAIDVWTGANPTPTTLTVSVPASDADTAPPSAN